MACVFSPRRTRRKACANTRDRLPIPSGSPDRSGVQPGQAQHAEVPPEADKGGDRGTGRLLLPSSAYPLRPFGGVQPTSQ
jgi:hypothetical protein